MCIRDREGGVYLNVEDIQAMDEDAKNVTIYCLQQAVKQVLYMVANSNAMQIPAGAKVVYTDMVEVDDEEVKLELAQAKAGEAYTSEVVANASLNTFYPYSSIVYTVEGLPEGMEFDAEAGVLTGTPAAAGEYTVTLTAEAEGYETASIQLPLVVAE